MVIEHNDCTYTWVCDTCGATTERLPLWHMPEYKNPVGWLWDWKRNKKPCPPTLTEDQLAGLRGFRNSFQFCGEACKNAYVKPEDYDGMPSCGLNLRAVGAYMNKMINDDTPGL